MFRFKDQTIYHVKYMFVKEKQKKNIYKKLYNMRTLSLLICSLASDRFSRSAAYRKRRRRFFTIFPTAWRHLFSASSELPSWFRSNSGGMNLSIFGNLASRIVYGHSAFILNFDVRKWKVSCSSGRS